MTPSRCPVCTHADPDDRHLTRCAYRRALLAQVDAHAEHADLPGPDPDGGIDLTDEEFAAFMEAARPQGKYADPVDGLGYRHIDDTTLPADPT